MGQAGLIGNALRVVGTAFFLAVIASTNSLAQAPAKANDDLALRQSEIADRFSRLEKLILRMAEFDAADNPRRSDLLKKAFSVSKDRHVQLQLEKLVGMLNQDKLSRAINNQKSVTNWLPA